MVEVKVVGWDQKCSFSMFGTLGQDSFGRFISVAATHEKFYFPDDALLYVKEFVPPAPVEEKKVEDEQPLPANGKPSRAHEMAVLARMARQEREAKASSSKKVTRKAYVPHEAVVALKETPKAPAKKRKAKEAASKISGEQPEKN